MGQIVASKHEGSIPQQNNRGRILSYIRQDLLGHFWPVQAQNPSECVRSLASKRCAAPPGTRYLRSPQQKRMRVRMNSIAVQDGIKVE